MGKPILSYRSNYVDRYFVFYVLAIPSVGYFPCLDSPFVCILWINESFVFFLLVSWLDYRGLSVLTRSDNIKFGAFLIHAFEFDYSCHAINIKPFGRGSKISADFMTD